MYCERYEKAYIEKMTTVLGFYQKRIYRKIYSLDSVSSLETMDHLRLPPVDGYTSISSGDKWGSEWSSVWLKFKLDVPASSAGKSIYVIPHTDAVETLCFLNGKPAGIINSKNDFLGGMHGAMFVTDNAAANEEYDIALECYAGHFWPDTAPFDFYGVEGRGDHSHTFSGIDVCECHIPTKDFCFNLATVMQLANLPQTNFISKDALAAVKLAFSKIIQDVINYTDEEIDASMEEANLALLPVLEKSYSESTRGHIGLVGHSHMDTAWLWPINETIRKCARTFSEALSLMRRYPEYTFMQSSVLHLDWMREYYPDIFEEIKERVKEGRYEPNGGAWVECDCNITGGESMIRQFLYGQRFTKEHFGYTSDTFWLPDTFGYSAAIPQIMKGCGLKYFYTTKLSWNDLNQFPIDTFIWRGNDGSEVLTHFNITQAIPDPATITKTVEQIKDKSTCDKRLIAYGFGDGGGGPTDGMLEFAKRSVGLPGIPESHHTTVSEFMKDLEKDADALPLYDGELYLELHRGTLTSIHDIKRNNRKAEIALHDLEFLNVASGEKRLPELDELYKTTLKNQFHDILPGSSITEVNELAREEMASVIAKTTSHINSFADKLTDDSDKVTVINTMPFARTGDTITEVDELSYVPEGSKAQKYVDSLGRSKMAISGLDIAPYAAKSYCKAPYADGASPFTYSGKHLETPIYTVDFDDDGYITSLFDKRTKRMVSKGTDPLGAMVYAEDFPRWCDNWEIDLDAFSKMKVAHACAPTRIVSDGSVMFRLRNEYVFGHDSKITVDTSFFADSPEIRYSTVVDWKEKHVLLKTRFDLAVRTPVVKNEIQFGFVERPTTRNDVFECAKYEVCNHKYSDLSESRYGVALLNDCKYGISVEGSTMMLTLHKGGTHPDYTGDPGVHEMTYSLLPHVGAFSADNTVAPAYALNYAPVIADGKASVDGRSFVSVDSSNIVCETIKSAEEVDGAYVLRLYECERNTTNCTLSFANPICEAFETDMLEEIVAPITVNDNRFDLTFKPFEIKTILVKTK